MSQRGWVVKAEPAGDGRGKFLAPAVGVGSAIAVFLALRFWLPAGEREPPPDATSAPEKPAAPPEPEAKKTVAASPGKSSVKAAPAVEHHFDFRTPESYERFCALFRSRTPFGMEMKHEQGRAVFRRSAGPGSRRDEDSLHIQADTLAWGTHWELNARVDLRMGVDEVQAGTKGPHARRADFHVRFMAPGEKPEGDCDSHARLYLGVLTAYGGFFTCALRGPGQQNNGGGRFGPFEGTLNPGLFGDNYLRKGRIRQPASADGKYDVRLTMHENELNAALNGVRAFQATLPATAVNLISRSPPAFFFGCSNETQEVYLDELRLRIESAPPEARPKINPDLPEF